MPDQNQFFSDQIIHIEDTFNSEIDKKLYNLYSFLPDGYFVKNLRGTNIYAFYQAFAQELASGSIETQAIWRDLYSRTARTNRLYHNFGTYFGLEKSAYQQNEDYDSTSQLEGYRHSIINLQEAAVLGGTTQAIRRVGQALTGMSPLIQESYRHPRWVLSPASGTISAVSGSKRFFTDPVKNWTPDELAGEYVRIVNHATPWVTVDNTAISLTDGVDYPEALDGVSFITVGNMLFGIGGIDGSNDSAAVYAAAIDSSSNMGGWVAQTPLPGAIGGFSGIALVSGNRILVMGGRDHSGTASATIYISNSIAVTDGEITGWTQLIDLPHAISGFGYVYADDVLWIFGGTTTSGVTSAIYKTTIRYNGTLVGWTYVSPLPIALGDVTAVLYDEELYIIGGYDGTAYKDTIYRASLVDSVLGTFSVEPVVIPTTGSRCSAIAYGDFIYIAGQYTGSYGTEIYRAALTDTGAVASIKQIGILDASTQTIGMIHKTDCFWLSYTNTTRKFVSFDTDFLTDMHVATAVQGVVVAAPYIYLIETGTNLISKFRQSEDNPSNIHYVSQYAGTVSAELSGPQDAVLHNGYLYVVDTGKYRLVKVLASDLSYVGYAGAVGPAFYQFGTPRGITAGSIQIDSDAAYECLFIADESNNRIVVRALPDMDNSLGFEGINAPTRVAYADGYLYVVSETNGTVSVYSTTEAVGGLNSVTLTHIRTLSGLTSPSGIWLNNGYMYIAERTEDRVRKFNAVSFAEIYQFGTNGSGNNQLSGPNNVSGGDGILAIADTGNNRISIWLYQDSDLVEILGNTHDTVHVRNNLDLLNAASGSVYTMGRSYLDETSLLYADSMELFGADIHVWGPFTNADYGEAIRDAFTQLCTNFRPAHTYFRYLFHDRYAAHFGQAALSAGDYDLTLLQVTSGSLLPLKETAGIQYSAAISTPDTASGSIAQPSGCVYVSPTIDIGTDYSLYDWYADYYLRVFNNSSGSVDIRFSDYSDYWDLSAWIPVRQDQRFLKEDMQRYAQYRVNCYASGSNEFEFRGFALKAMKYAITAQAVSDVSTGNAPLTVQFTDQSTGFITSWLWDFGDNTFSTDQNPTHVYDVIGAYTVTLTVSDGYISDTTTLRINAAALTAAFTADAFSGDAPLAIQFTDTSEGAITGWEWDFGDGDTSTDQNPTHTFANYGTYAVTLRVTGSDVASSIAVETVRVFDVAFDTTPVVATVPATVSFTNQSQGAIDSYLWSFGNGLVSGAENPDATYPEAGTFTVSLQGTSGEVSATVTAPDMVTVNPMTLSYRKTITINNDSIVDDVANFPVILRFTFSAEERAHITDVGNIRVTDNNGTLLPLEIGSYNASTGLFVGYTKTNLSATLPNILHIRYGNTTLRSEPESSPYGAWNVWDDNYVFVSHTDLYRSSYIQDSTRYQQHGIRSILNYPEFGTGTIKTHIEFRTANPAYFNSADTEKLDMSILTISGLIRFLSLNTAMGILAKGRMYQILKNASNQLQFAGTDIMGQPILFQTQDAITDTSTPQFFTIQYGLSRRRIALPTLANPDSSVALSIVNSGVGVLRTSRDDLTIGYSPDYGFLNANVEELRISNILRDSAWYLTEFYNIMDSSFISVGDEESDNYDLSYATTVE